MKHFFSTLTFTILIVLSAKAQDETKHFVGEEFGGGIVFKVDSVGKHGLICSKVTIGKMKPWSNIQTEIIGKTAESDSVGKKNTNAIINQKDHKSSAALLCKNYKNWDYGTGVFTDWYLPSINELTALYSVKDMIDAKYAKEAASSTLCELIGIHLYWSSTEENATQAQRCKFVNGEVSVGEKKNFGTVRAIRSF